VEEIEGIDLRQVERAWSPRYAFLASLTGGSSRTWTAS
jgi:hypothetical protein